MSTNQQSTTMILIPGAMHGAWAWDRVKPLLEGAGYRVIAPDLPGMGPDPRIAPADVTMAGWAGFVADLAAGIAGPVILAGHSRGGLVIGEAAELVPERLVGLIYVSGMIAMPQQTGMQAGRDPDVPPASAEAKPGRETKAMVIASEHARAIFYNCCTRADADWAIARLEPEPPAPLETPAGVSWERWGQVPRGYIECLRDETLRLTRQRRFQAAAPCDPVIQLDTDHSPLLSRPRELAEAMVRIAQSFAARAGR